MAIDAKKHTTIAAGETPSRAGLAAAFLSPSDVVPVANATEAAQVAVAVTATGQNLATSPLVVSRADAAGLHQVEVTRDPTGQVLVPVSGVLHFASTGTRDTWTSANSALLTTADRCVAGTSEFAWNGTRWLPVPRAEAAGVLVIAGTGQTTVTFPTNRFTVPPIVTLLAIHASNVVVPRLIGGTLTAAQFDAQVFTIGGGQVAGSIYWHAIQMTPTTAEG